MATSTAICRQPKPSKDLAELAILILEREEMNSDLLVVGKRERGKRGGGKKGGRTIKHMKLKELRRRGQS